MPSIIMKKNIENDVIELYKKKTPITKIITDTGVSVTKIYGILSRNNIPLRSGQKTYKHTVIFDDETEQLLQQANPANISAWVCERIKGPQKEN